jgi:hypothetical protein
VSQSVGTSQSRERVRTSGLLPPGRIPGKIVLEALPQETIFRSNMRICPRRRTARSAMGKFFLLVASVLILFCHAGLYAQSDKDKEADKPSTTSRVRIEVTGGDENKPVADASVYLKFAEERKVLKDRTIEFNLKTNQEGVARSPEIPKGKILIQIVAPTWKTFGEWYQVNQDEQTIKIHLVRPTTKWY